MKRVPGENPYGRQTMSPPVAERPSGPSVLISGSARMVPELLNALFLRRPSLSEECQEVSQGLFVGATLLFRQLPGPLVELGSHFGRFLHRTTQRNKHRREFSWIHASSNSSSSRRRNRTSQPAVYWTASAGTIRTLSTPMRLLGRSGAWVAAVAIFSSTSSPLINLPNAVYCRSRKCGLP